MLHKNLNSSKGQGLPLNVIVIAVIVLLVLVVIVFIFTGKTGTFTKEIGTCESRNGECVSGTTCTTGPIIKDAKCEAGKVCCLKLLTETETPPTSNP